MKVTRAPFIPKHTTIIGWHWFIFCINTT